VTPTLEQVEACRLALGFVRGGASAWDRMPQDERLAVIERWLAALAYKAGLPPATQRMVDELYGTAFRKEE